ncbi:hypothetical protein QAD02_019093 [Eretmocerus hayati]|uniref:Uncharacterized protein n=1 Tax=Eretmocerus hayati TaxID=131215 RepID=A0ACC2PIN5_9HYME|nr:hypothetical protein QAD02_019093 [Eretmocerus hayati]
MAQIYCASVMKRDGVMDKVAYTFFLVATACANGVENHRYPTDGNQDLGHRANPNGDFVDGSYDFEHYPSYQEIEAYLSHLAQRHGDVKIITIGKSYDGRDIWGIKISNGNQSNSILFIDAGIHAREWIAPTTALYAIKSFIQERTKFPNIDIIVVPLLNPDGYEFSRSSSNNRMWRKNRSQNLNSTCRGVDLNRNFDINWDAQKGNSDPCRDTYGGRAPFSEPETRALKNFFLSNMKRVKVHITLHSPISSIMYPGGEEDSQVRLKRKLLDCLAQNAVSALTIRSRNLYKTGPISKLVGVAAGDSAYWTMTIGGSETSFVIELPGKPYRRANNSFDIQEKYIVHIGSETYRMLSVFAQYAQTGVCLSKRTCDLPAKAMFVNNEQCNSENGCPNCKIDTVKVGKTDTFPFDGNPNLRTTEETELHAQQAFGRNEAVVGIKGSLFNYIALINERIKKLKLPSFIQRLPRDVSDYEYWKASELKTFLLIYSPIILNGIMPKKYYEHHLLLVHGLTLLNSSIVTDENIEEARKLLKESVSRNSGVRTGRGNICSTCVQLLRSYTKVCTKKFHPEASSLQNRQEIFIEEPEKFR